MARILIYAQSLQGVGHAVRARELARHLGADHRVWLVNGGRRLQGGDLPGSVRLLQLPGLVVRQERLMAMDRAAGAAACASSAVLAKVFEERADRLREWLEEACPDLVMIEHFPFGKQAFGDEILALLAQARQLNPAVKVLCSLRDLPISKELSALSVVEQRNRVLPILNTCFDEILVHADPRFYRLDDVFPWMKACTLAVHYTGFVSQPVVTAAGACLPTVVVSTGGLGDGGRLAGLCRAAWRELRGRGALGDHRLVIFSSVAEADSGILTVGDAPAEAGVELHHFGTEFLAVLATAELSISQAGYNTSVNLLNLGVRSLLLPNATVEDQWRRAARLEELGLARLLDPERTDSSTLAAAMETLLEQPRPQHNLNLGGGPRTRQVVDQILMGTECLAGGVLRGDTGPSPASW